MFSVRRDLSSGDSLSDCYSSKKIPGKRRVGGQAVIEGVMMRSANSMAIAVRRQDGKIEVKKERLSIFSEQGLISKIPLLRGFISLIAALVLGIRALNFSVNQALGEEEDRNPFTIITMFIIAICFGLFLFLILPIFLTKGVLLLIPLLFKNEILFNIIDGTIRLMIFLLYIGFISLFKDIRRVFQYHGAEHKSIFAYEYGEALEPEKVKTFSRLHPRCGTSFLLMVMLVSIFIFTIIPHHLSLGEKILTRLILVPLIAGISYEMIRIADKNRGHKGIYYLIKPGLWLQRLTAREPSEGELEVAIRALKEVLEMDGIPTDRKD